jgi:transmembrane sensor
MDLKRHAAREQAAQWIAKLDRGLRPGEGTVFRKWLRRSVNRTSILEIARRSSGPEVLALLAELFPIGINADTRKNRRGSAVMLASGAAAVGVVIFGALMLNDQSHWARFAASWTSTHNSAGAIPHPPLAKGEYSTAIGQQQRIQLPDGSALELNTDTSVVVTYSLRERDISLQHGEVSFRAAREPDRPFFVRAGGRRFQAAGTQFDVRVLTSDSVELIVTEGSVTVFDTPMEQPETPALARLRSNMTFGDITVEAPARVELEPGLQFGRKVEASDLKDLLAWQRGRIVFKGQRLEEVLAQMHRYTTTRIVLSDEALSDTRLIGDFRAGDIDDFLELLRRNYLIDSRRDRFGRVVLSRLTPPISRL